MGLNIGPCVRTQARKRKQKAALSHVLAGEPTTIPRQPVDTRRSRTYVSGTPDGAIPPPGRTDGFMDSNDDTSLENRLSRAAHAKSAMLEKFKRTLDPKNPALIEKRQQREAIATARAHRAVQREAARKEYEREAARQAELTARAAAAADLAAAEETARLAAEKAQQEDALRAQQKAERDTRYAARKAAKKVRRRGY